jgi:dTDP-4-dehydrorhamnose 3,5-epimerase-like enzyme
MAHDNIEVGTVEHPLPALIGDARWISFRKFFDPRGALTAIEGTQDVPFEIKRVFYFYDVPAGESRGAHAHRQQSQVIICLAGGFTVVLDDSVNQQSVRLSRPWLGMLLPPGLWASQTDFDGGTVGLVLASNHFDEADYVRDYAEYKRRASS